MNSAIPTGIAFMFNAVMTILVKAKCARGLG